MRTQAFFRATPAAAEPRPGSAPGAGSGGEEQGTRHAGHFINCTDLIQLQPEPIVYLEDMLYLIVIRGKTISICQRTFEFHLPLIFIVLHPVDVCDATALAWIVLLTKLLSSVAS